MYLTIAECRRQALKTNFVDYVCLNFGICTLDADFVTYCAMTCTYYILADSNILLNSR